MPARPPVARSLTVIRYSSFLCTRARKPGTKSGVVDRCRMQPKNKPKVSRSIAVHLPIPRIFCEVIVAENKICFMLQCL